MCEHTMSRWCSNQLIIRHITARLGLRQKATAANPITIEETEEPFRRGVIATVANRAHAAAIDKPMTPLLWRSMTAAGRPLRLVDGPCRGTAPRPRY